MKRIGNLYEKIYSIENLILAEKRARKGKTKTKEVILFSKQKELNLIKLRIILIRE